MNYSRKRFKRKCKKVIRKIFAIMAVVGLVLIVGAVGKDDFYTMELGCAYPFSETLKYMGIGAILTLPEIIILKLDGWMN